MRQLHHHDNWTRWKQYPQYNFSTNSRVNEHTGRFLPTETLWYLSEAVQRKQEGSVAIATQWAQKVTRSGKPLLCGRIFCYHGDGVKQEVLQIISKLLITQELQIWPTIVGWREDPGLHYPQNPAVNIWMMSDRWHVLPCCSSVSSRQEVRKRINFLFSTTDSWRLANTSALLHGTCETDRYRDTDR